MVVNIKLNYNMSSLLYQVPDRMICKTSAILAESSTQSNTAQAYVSVSSSRQDIYIHFLEFNRLRIVSNSVVVVVLPFSVIVRCE